MGEAMISRRGGGGIPLGLTTCTPVLQNGSCSGTNGGTVTIPSEGLYAVIGTTYYSSGNFDGEVFSINGIELTEEQYGAARLGANGSYEYGIAQFAVLQAKAVSDGYELTDIIFGTSFGISTTIKITCGYTRGTQNWSVYKYS